MRHRFPNALRLLPAVVAVLLFVQMSVSGQQARASAKNKPAAPASVAKKPATGASANSGSNRTPWGDPDLQGVYTFSTLTPLERPKGIQGKDSYTEAELAELEEQLTATITTEGRAPRSG